MEGKNGNYGILTVTQYSTLEALEKEDEGREKTFCKEVESIIFKTYVDCFNPRIKVNFLKLPLRKTRTKLLTDGNLNSRQYESRLR
jgi:hypothetical protein